MRVELAGLCAFLLVAASGRAQQDFSKVEIKTTHVAGSVYLLEGAGGNIAVSAGADGLLIVDDQFAPLADKIEVALSKLNKGSLRYVLNTHFHGDHTGGNVFFGKNAAIIAQDNVRRRLNSPTLKVKGGLPVITFSNSLSLHFNGEEIRIRHLPPGHTDGDSIVEFTGSRVDHTGDQFFSGRFPNIDPGGGGNVRGFIRNVDELVKTIPAEVQIIPGHGPLSTAKELREFQTMLRETSSLVQERVAAGKTLDEVQAAGLPEQWSRWAVPTLPTRRWLELLYQGLKP